MAQIEIRKAERVKSKLRLAIAGPSGSGKTMGSLKLAKGIGQKILLIDTERGSGDLYADLFEYDIITLEPPFKPDALIEALRAGEAADYDVIVVDSLSHFWADEGGLLDQADKLEASGKNRFTLWADITPQHRRLVNALLNSPKHIVATMRSKQAYEMERDEKTGKSSVKKMGLAPVQREGMEYEFTVFFDVDSNHHAKASKDRTAMFNNEVFMIDESIGQRISKWLNTGRADTRALKREIMFAVRDRLELAPPTAKEDAADWWKMAIPKLTALVGDPIEWKEDNIEAIAAALVKIQDKQAAYKAVWESPAANAPQGPGTEGKAQGEGKVETPAQKPAEVEGAGNKDEADMPPTA
jgi:hypothetical protein